MAGDRSGANEGLRRPWFDNRGASDLFVPKRDVIALKLAETGGHDEPIEELVSKEVVEVVDSGGEAAKDLVTLVKALPGVVEGG